MLTPGTVFAGYTIERTLGNGGMGEVYLARHPRLPRSDALKLMSEQLSRSDVYRRRFSSEADIACQVKHESVVRVFDRGEDGDRLWIAMEYVEGRDLAETLLAERRLSPHRAVALLERIAAGLDSIHARGLLHRDVKPGNILVSRDVSGPERAVLTDFGIAKSAADSLGLTGVGDLVATLHYAAPEQFQLHSDQLDRRVDVYALGCVFYEMLTGQVPLEGDSVVSFWQVLQSDTAVAPSRLVAGLPAQLDAVIAKALAKDRDQRYETAGELAIEARAAIAELSLQAVLGGVVPAAPTVIATSGAAGTGYYGSSALPAGLPPLMPPAPSGAPSPPSRRKRGWLIGAVAAAVVLVAAAVTVTVLVLGARERPGMPGGVTVVAGRGTVTVEWTTSTGKVDHYVIYRDGKPVAPSVRGTSFKDKLKDTSPHRYKVVAVDKGGNMSAPSIERLVAAQVRELTPVEDALRAKLPAGLVEASSCEPILFGFDARVNVAISCKPEAGQAVAAPAKLPQTIEVFSTASADSLTAVLAAEITKHAAQPGNCSATPQHGTWNYTETPTVINGQIICYTGARSYLLWSYENEHFYVRISASASYQGLLAYWQDAALHVP
jgi:predicted Ser/Thr protein kinase